MFPSDPPGWVPSSLRLDGPYDTRTPVTTVLSTVKSPYGLVLVRMGLIWPLKWGTLGTRGIPGEVVMSEWTEWVERVTSGGTSRQVGERIGHSHTTALRWMHDGAPPEAVIALALAYDADVFEALVAAGWLRREDVAGLNIETALRRLSSVRLTRELYRRALAKYGDGAGFKVRERGERL